MATDIQFTEVTTGELTGTGVFDQLMRSIKAHIMEEYTAGRITGKEYATVYLGGMQSAMAHSVNFVLNEKTQEQEVDNKMKQGLILDSQKVAIDTDTIRKGEVHTKQLAKLDEEIYLMTNTRDSKVQLSQAQADKTAAEALLVAEQKVQLEATVGYNNKIKALDALSDTYGTFGAGGLTLSSDMWTTYFSIVSNLAGVTPPTSTAVSKVV